MELLINGNLVEGDRTDVDDGFFYGYGLFETILIKGGKAVLAKEHLNRLNKGLVQLGIHKEISHWELEHAIEALKCFDGVMKINVTEVNTVFSTRKSSYDKALYDSGVRIKISDVLRNPTSPTVSLKTMNYMDNLLVLREAKAEGWNDALFLNHRDEICETAIANIFFVRGSEVVTPKASAGMLKGILRQWVMAEIHVEEADIYCDDMLSMDGAFVTNSVMGIMKVAAIGKTVYGDNPIIAALQAKYEAFLEGGS